MTTHLDLFLCVFIAPISRAFSDVLLREQYAFCLCLKRHCSHLYGPSTPDERGAMWRMHKPIQQGIRDIALHCIQYGKKFVFIMGCIVIVMFASWHSYAV